MKQLFIVEISAETVVLAENEQEAMEIAEGYAMDLTFEAHRPERLTALPDGWDEDSLPYGDDSDKTIGQWIDEGAAPKYVGRTNRALKPKSTP